MTKKLFFLLLILAGTTPMTAQKNVKGLKNAFKKDFLIGVAVNQRNVSVKPQPTELQEGVFNWGGGLDFSREGTAMTDSIAQCHAERYAELFRVFHQHSDVIDCVTFWNLGDRDSWLGAKNYPLLFDEQYLPKPSYTQS